MKPLLTLKKTKGYTKLTVRFNFILLGMFIGLNCYGQYVPNNPVSPEVSGFSKVLFGQNNNYNGKPNISIPIYTLKAGNVQIPINLNYQSGGVKVGQKATEVGLGWNISIPVIYRKINGNPDDSYRGWINNRTDFSSEIIYQELRDLPRRDKAKKIEDLIDVSSDGWTTGEGASYDTEPDEFIFNIPGVLSGSFYLDQQGNPIKKELGDYKIIMHTYLFSGWEEMYIAMKVKLPSDISEQKVIAGFTIITPDGNKYSFTSWENYYIESEHYQPEFNDYRYGWDAEFTYWMVVEKIPQKINTAFFLSEIIMPNEHIKFDYDAEYTKSINRTNIRRSDKYIHGIYATNVITLRQRLKSITSSSIKILFNRETEREDTYDVEKRLDNIIIKDLIDNEQVGKYIFNYSYFTSLGMSDTEDKYKFNYKRLKLNGIDRFGKDNSEFHSHSFTYNETNKLPNKNSFEMDMWGYYNNNGATELEDLVPAIYYHPDENNWKKYSPFLVNNFVGEEMFFEGYDRSMNADMAKAFTLKEIEYPTGGRKKLFWEANKFLLDGNEYEGGGLRIAKKELLDEKGEIANSINYEYLDLNGNSSGNIFSLPTIVIPRLAQHITDILDLNSSLRNWQLENGLEAAIPGWFVVLSAFSNGTVSTKSGAVGYSRVTEKHSNEGYTVYNYSISGNIEDQGNIDFSTSEVDYNWHGINPDYQRIEKKFITPFGNSSDSWINGLTDYLEDGYQYSNSIDFFGYNYDGLLLRKQVFNNVNQSVNDKKIKYKLIQSNSNNILFGNKLGALSSNVFGYSINLVLVAEMQTPSLSTETSLSLNIQVDDNDSELSEYADFANIPYYWSSEMSMLSYERYKIMTNYKIVPEYIESTEQGVTSKVEYSYKPSIEKSKVIEERHFGSQNEIITKHYTYSDSEIRGIGLMINDITVSDLASIPIHSEYTPNDVYAEAIGQMAIKNIIKPIEILTYNNDVLINAELHQYKTDRVERLTPLGDVNIGTWPLLNKTAKIINAEGIADFNSLVIAGISRDDASLEIDSNYKDAISSISYSQDRHIIEYNEKGNVSSYIYGYGQAFDKHINSYLDKIFELKYPVPNYIIAKSTNAKRQQIAHTSFEFGETGFYYSYNGFSKIYGSLNDLFGYTGKNSFNGKITYFNFNQIGEYVLSFYSLGTNEAIINGENVEGSASSPWKYNEVTLLNPEDITIESGENSFIDEIRIYPKGAQMVTYTHAPHQGITSQTDPNGLSTFYEYDNFNRLRLIRDADGNILVNYEYNYASKSN